MEIVLGKNNQIFIEESSFVEKNFYLKLKNIVEESIADKKKIKFIVDKNIHNKVQDYATSLKFHEAYLLDGLLDILSQYDMLSFVDTNSYLNFDDLVSELKIPKTSNLYFVTQRESVFKTFKDVKNTYDNIKFFKYENDTFEEWTENVNNSKPLNAFYLSEDNYVNKIDTTGLDYVYSPKYGYLKIDISSQMTGGEGSVYRTYNNMMVKIFKKENIAYPNFKKLSKMIEMNVYNPFICWPRDLVYVNGTFVGYLMDEVKEAQTLLSLRLQNFSEYSHIDRFVLCYNFLVNVKYLHEKGILIGDLKPDNILVRSPSEVYFIDCGCYQIDDYACPVCHPEYTKRIFKKDEIKQQLRTIEDEYYPINKIAFEIMMMKNHTYSPDNMEIENADKNQFFYPLDLSKITNQSEDTMIWSGLTPAMREYFYYYFKQGKVTDLDVWTNEMKLFLDKIQKGE